MPRVTIYTTQYCAWCEATRDLLRQKRIYFDDVDVTGDHVMREKLVAMSGGAMTVPQIWINGRHVGGYRDLQRLDHSGQLDTMLGLREGDSASMEMA